MKNPLQLLYAGLIDEKTQNTYEPFKGIQAEFNQKDETISITIEHYSININFIDCDNAGIVRIVATPDLDFSDKFSNGVILANMLNSSTKFVKFLMDEKKNKFKGNMYINTTEYIDYDEMIPYIIFNMAPMVYVLESIYPKILAVYNKDNV